MWLLDAVSGFVEFVSEKEDDEHIERSGYSWVQTENASDPKEETRTGRIGTSGLKVFALFRKPDGVLDGLLVSLGRRRHILFLFSTVLFFIGSSSSDVALVVGIIVDYLCDAMTR
jgi:hypothetical protein